jgi:hypothetical protein
MRQRHTLHRAENGTRCAHSRLDALIFVDRVLEGPYNRRTKMPIFKANMRRGLLALTGVAEGG